MFYRFSRQLFKKVGPTVKELKERLPLRIRNNNVAYDLIQVANKFEKYAPINLNARRNQLGLIVTPSLPNEVSTVFLTNHLTLLTLQEALSMQANFIYSYHSPLSQALESLRPNSWFIARFWLGHKVAVFSSNISMHAITIAKVNSWLINCFDLKTVRPIKTFNDTSFQINVKYKKEDDLNSVLSNEHVEVLNKGKTKVKIQVPSSEFSQLINILEDKDLGYKVENNEKFEAGKLGTFKMPISIADAVMLLKKRLQLDGVYIAFGKEQTLNSHISKVAVCAGSGSTVLQDEDAQLFVTGEMNREELNAANSKGISIIMCRQTINQNGLLNDLASTLEKELPGLKIVVAKEDTEHASFEWH